MARRVTAGNKRNEANDWPVYLLLFVLQMRVSPQGDVFSHRQNNAHQLVHCTLKHTQEQHTLVCLYVNVISLCRRSKQHMSGHIW